MITTLLQGERWIQPVPLGRSQSTQTSLSRQHPLIPAQTLPVWELQGVLQVHRNHPESWEQPWSRRLQPDPAQGADPCPRVDPPCPQHTLLLAGEALPPPFQADNRPFPGKSLHAAVQTDPQSTAAMRGWRARHTDRLYSLQRGNRSCLSPREGTHRSLRTPERTLAPGACCPPSPAQHSCSIPAPSPPSPSAGIIKGVTPSWFLRAEGFGVKQIQCHISTALP